MFNAEFNDNLVKRWIRVVFKLQLFFRNTFVEKGIFFQMNFHKVPLWSTLRYFRDQYIVVSSLHIKKQNRNRISRLKDMLENVSKFPPIFDLFLQPFSLKCTFYKDIHAFLVSTSCLYLSNTSFQMGWLQRAKVKYW